MVILNRDYSPGKRGGYTTDSYLEALETGLIDIYSPDLAFQQDNARIHTSKQAQEWFETHGIHVLEWPPHSPDLNPIEPVWRLLKEKLYQLYPKLAYLGRSETNWKFFKQAICEAWDALDQRVIDSLILSVTKRVHAVRLASGYYTRY